ncbi:hypothetical protein LSH36_162g00011 [Paralvinella palmiformis]|uniref:Uncharacterized protein n=1 Tax=Paralvinella palmiformis TaxID=53620 RepID=A0AAD9JTY2_9ANNE|nr:hypothetical protein LSH36_162g00011 [Paralvinella palmiformis]
MWGVAFLSVSSRVGDDKDKDLGVCHLDTVDGNSPRMNNVDSVPDDVRNSSAVNTTTANSARSTPLSSTVAPQAVSAIGYYQPDAAAPIPMIILHDNPLSLTAIGGMEPSNGGGRGHHQRALNPYNPRHLRVIRRQEDELLPSYLLDGQALENIVIRNAPVPDQIVFGHQEAPPISDDADEGYTKGYATGDLESFGEQLAEASYAPSTSRSSGDAALTSRRSRRNSRQRLL